MPQKEGRTLFSKYLFCFHQVSRQERAKKHHQGLKARAGRAESWITNIYIIASQKLTWWHSHRVYQGEQKATLYCILSYWKAAPIFHVSVMANQLKDCQSLKVPGQAGFELKFGPRKMSTSVQGHKAAELFQSVPVPSLTWVQVRKTQLKTPGSPFLR